MAFEANSLFCRGPGDIQDTGARAGFAKRGGARLEGLEAVTVRVQNDDGGSAVFPLRAFLVVDEAMEVPGMQDL